MARQSVSLICTVYNEIHSVDAFLDGIAAQTRLPDEIIIADGGSTDGTAERLRERGIGLRLPLRVLRLPRVSIARGRNAAIREARHPVITVTDAGAVPDARWLERLVAPLEGRDPPDVVAGWYRIDARTPDEATIGLTMVHPDRRITADRVSPSSRSIAFARTWWERVGGYPEWLTNWGEDTVFNRLLRARGARMAFAPDAFVWWRPDPGLGGVFRRNFRYGFGDGEAGVWPPHLRLTAILALTAAALEGLTWRWAWSPVGLGGAILLYLEYPLIAHRRLPSWKSLLLMPAARLAMDAGLWLGFLLGVVRRVAGRRVTLPRSPCG